MTTDPMQPVPMYGPEFAGDPHTVYAKLRAYGACAPVELAPGVRATLVTSYRAALEVLHDTDTYSKDPRVWQHTLPADSQLLPMLMWRANALFNDGEVHARYRRATTDSLALIEPHELRDLVHRSADSLISGFADRGEVDLISEYVRVLPLLIFSGVFGVSEAASPRLVAAAHGMFDAHSPEEAHQANDEFGHLLAELVAAKREKPGPDFTSWLIDHPVELSEEEVIGQLVTTLAAGYDPLTNLMGNALARMLSDPRYYRTVSSGALTVTDAITDVLWNDPPVANYSAHYPRRDVDLHGTWIPAGTPVLVSYAAANTAPADLPPGPRSDSGAHLAFAAGPHACPAQQPAVLIATTAIDRLTSWLCDIRLTVPFDQLTWRPGPFHRALTELPAVFTPIAPDQKGTSPWTVSRSSSTPPEETSPAKQPVSGRQDRPSVSYSPATSKRGPSPATP
ncbi:cytochrome P450 [Streptomyces johnsoniae]|uniref:Cytochrome P450 n=1 Tax=Streptomyces johnsoniae TaxID=3075532 RepID=A0ABU2SCA3_9ACTN|nr:cytochrome P450 [Streptomyces sp. DSM 41886]MDT0446612.1 cytochrome P450 [Streptomyces sp. DSM 41886]